MTREANVIYIGRKPLMNYVLAVVTSFNASNADKVVLKARGRAITTAVDVAEVSRRRFLENVRIDKIDIGSEDIPVQEENRTKTVSTMNITLLRAPPTRKEMRDEDKEKKSTGKKHHVELTDIKGIGAKRAEKLKSFGINSLQDLVNSDLTKLSEDLRISKKRLSKWVDEAKKAVRLP